MPKPRAVAVSVPLVLPWLLTAEERAALDIPHALATAAAEPTTRSPLFLLCSSRKHKSRFLLPKGGVEKGEDAEFAAVREGWVS
jgi:8-oxo-dGTP pyrophosphatase MutT (NUDIX family)